jgi:rubrerythrin
MSQQESKSSTTSTNYGTAKEEKPPDKKFLCEICRSHIANFSEAYKPFEAEMFSSPDPKHGAIAPFSPLIDWPFFKCPICGNTPWAWPANMSRIEHPKRILTDEGYYNISFRPVYKCDICGYKTHYKPAFGRHVRLCNEKEKAKKQRRQEVG